MKKLLLALSVIATIAQGCEQIEKKDGIGNENGKSIVRFCLDDSSVNGGSASTKLTGSSDEEALNNVEFIIFDDSGEYVTSLLTDGATAEMEIYEGSYTAAAIVNMGQSHAGENFSYGSVDEISVPLEDNSKGNLIMYAEKSFTIDESGADVNMEARRNVAKIAVGTIKNEMKDPVFQKQAFEIQRIFVSNVSGLSDLRGENSPTVWYNKNGLWEDETDDIKSLLEDDNIDRTIALHGEYSQEHYYYVYPNDIADDSYDALWSPRFTRLVIEAALDGKTCYYPIPFGNIEANHSYIINNLTITKPGTDNPWERIDGEMCNFTITVVDWEKGLTTDKII